MNAMTEPGARADLLPIISGYKASQAVHVAAALGLGDLLSSGPKTISELAGATQSEPRALYRLMRALASIGVFSERPDGAFVHTPMSEFLRRDVRGSHAFIAQLSGRASVWHAWGDLLRTVRTGGTAFDRVHGRSIWDFREHHPEESIIFDRAMASGTEHYAEAVMDAYDFGRFDSIVDVGGGDGAFLNALLARYPRMRGTLFDQPHVIAKNKSLTGSVDISQRCRLAAGDFFVGVPSDSDAYLLKWILHDWDDTAAIEILRSCRRSMKSTSRLLVVEHVIGAANDGPEGKFLDLTMLVMNGGQERTREEFSALFAKAGFRLESLVPTASLLSLIEAVPELPRAA